MNHKILIVDDDHAILESLSKLLGTEGYEIALAEDGRQAIEKLVENHIGLLLLDLGLPVKDGWATLRWLAETNPLFPVIVITGQSNQQTQAARAGADVLMEKPLDVPQLLRTIHDLLDEPMECRVQRATHRPVGFQYVPRDSEQFRQLQNKRFTTPYPCPNLKDT